MVAPSPSHGRLAVDGLATMLGDEWALGITVWKMLDDVVFSFESFRSSVRLERSP